MRDPYVDYILKKYPEASWFADSSGWTIYNKDEVLGHARKIGKAWEKAAKTDMRKQKKTPRDKPLHRKVL